MGPAAIAGDDDAIGFTPLATESTSTESINDKASTRERRGRYDTTGRGHA